VSYPSELFWKVADWSIKTFGSCAERGPTGPLKHLIKEANEALAAPKDISEYADCQILVWDAALRAGFNFSELQEAIEYKLKVLQGRTYPKVADGEVSEHLKEPNNA
jgi:hypothetical protein